MLNSAKRGGLLVALTLSALAPAAAVGPARSVSIDYPGAETTLAYGINPAGDIVGAYIDGQAHEHGFLLRRGTFSSFDYPDAVWTEAYGITPEGDIAGQYGFAGVVHGFVLRNGTFYTADVPGQPNTMPLGISPNGTIAGCVHGGPGGMHGFVMTADGDSSVQGPAGTMHTGINASGDVTGYGTPNPPGFDASYIISNGVTSWFSFPGSTFTRARDISATGDIIGIYQDAATKTIHSFLLRHGEFASIDVDLPGATLTRAFGTNARGDIVGYFADATGFHGFLISRRPQ